eukprot:1157212-Pelagomonas_calceolata.AAC.4
MSWQRFIELHALAAYLQLPCRQASNRFAVKGQMSVLYAEGPQNAGCCLSMPAWPACSSA